MPTQFELILFFRLLISVLLGVLIGFERTNRYKEAGIRTHAIVALGSCLLMILSKYGFMDTMDADHSRIAAQVVTGIGFLGAGMILVRKNTVSGLTTAAGIWTTSAVGMTIGAGMYFIGVSTAVLIILVQIVFHTKWFSRFDRSNDTFMVNCNTASIRDIIDYIKSLDIEIVMYRVGEADSNRVNIELVLRYPNGLNKQLLKEKMLKRLTDLDVEE
jgi:putative Mg2+ transporter-C (MgtC) family protein